MQGWIVSRFAFTIPQHVSEWLLGAPFEKYYLILGMDGRPKDYRIQQVLTSIRIDG